jgi:hypothetical protein
VTLEKRERPAQEPDRGRCFLVREDLGIGKTARIVDRDMHALPTNGLAVHPGRVPLDRRVVAALPVADPLASASLDPSELLQVDMDQLPSDGPFIALRGLQPEPAQTAHPNPGQDPRHRREWELENFRDLRARET